MGFYRGLLWVIKGDTRGLHILYDKHRAQELSFQMAAHDLKSTDFWKRKCDPYFMMNRIEAQFH